MFSRTDKSLLGQWWWTVDRPLLVACFTLITIGVAMVATASPAVAEHLNLGAFYFLKKHLILLTPAILLMLGMSLLSPRQVWRLSSLAFIGLVFALILVLIVGPEIKGAKRWLPLPGFSIQPSEFLKPVFAIIAAWFMASYKKNGNYVGILIAAGFYILSVTLLMMQPDFGMTFVVTLIWCSQIFIAGLPLRYVALMLGFLVIGSAFVYMAFDHVQSRVDRFLNPASGDNYQVEKSLDAVKEGGFIGKGPGQGSVKLSLPDAHSDFIFSVGAEEMGLIFMLIVIGLFAYITLRSLTRLMEQDDIFQLLAAGGILTMFGAQAFIHIGSALNILPAKGMTLPFVSYGGSSVMAVGFAMGAVLALTRKTKRL